jgi:peptidoglycan/LPS O-acetylase OafA/YrhL
MSPGRQMMPALTGLRFLLAALVMMYHLGGQQMTRSPLWASSIVSFGYLAVNAFFILSGFVLAQSYLDPRGALRGSRKDFWIARFARIYPIYALAMLFSFPNRFDYGLGAFTKSGEAFATVSVFTLTQAWIPAFSSFVNAAAWSLSAEVFFYFCFPRLTGLVAGKSRRGLIGVIAACWILLLAPAELSILASQGAMGPSLAVSASTVRWAAFIQFNPALHLPAFVMGIAGQRLFSLEKSWRSSAISWGSAVLIAAILGAGWQIPAPLVHKGFLAPLFLTLIFGLASGRGALAAMLAHPVAVKLGEASYSVYLLHLPFQGVALAINNLTFHLAVSSWTFLIADFVMTIAVSLLALTYVETPYRKSIAADLRRWMERPSKAVYGIPQLE